MSVCVCECVCLITFHFVIHFFFHFFYLPEMWKDNPENQRAFFDSMAHDLGMYWIYNLFFTWCSLMPPTHYTTLKQVGLAYILTNTVFVTGKKKRYSTLSKNGPSWPVHHHVRDPPRQIHSVLAGSALCGSWSKCA